MDFSWKIQSIADCVDHLVQMLSESGITYIKSVYESGSSIVFKLFSLHDGWFISSYFYKMISRTRNIQWIGMCLFFMWFVQ